MSAVSRSYQVPAALTASSGASAAAPAAAQPLSRERMAAWPGRGEEELEDELGQTALHLPAGDASTDIPSPGKPNSLPSEQSRLTQSISARERAVANRESRWLADVTELLQSAKGAILSLNGSAGEYSGPTSLAELQHSLAAADTMRLISGRKLEGLGSDCSAGVVVIDSTSDGSRSDSSSRSRSASATRGGGEEPSTADEALRRRMQSARFLAWQQKQLGEDLVRKLSGLQETKKELKQLQEDLEAQEDIQRSEDEKLREEEEKLLAEETRLRQEVEEGWKARDEQEAALDVVARAAQQRAAEYSQQIGSLEDARKSVAEAEEQAKALEGEACALADLRHEVETREATLHCVDDAWHCLVQQHLAQANLERPAASAKLRAQVAERIVEELVRNDVTLRHNLDTVREVVRRSLGTSAGDLPLGSPDQSPRVRHPLLASQATSFDELLGSRNVQLPCHSDFVGLYSVSSLPTQSPRIETRQAGAADARPSAASRLSTPGFLQGGGGGTETRFSAASLPSTRALEQGAATTARSSAASLPSTQSLLSGVPATAAAAVPESGAAAAASGAPVAADTSLSSVAATAKPAAAAEPAGMSTPTADLRRPMPSGLMTTGSIADAAVRRPLARTAGVAAAGDAASPQPLVAVGARQPASSAAATEGRPPPSSGGSTPAVLRATPTAGGASRPTPLSSLGGAASASGASGGAAPAAHPIGNAAQAVTASSSSSSTPSGITAHRLTATPAGGLASTRGAAAEVVPRETPAGVNSAPSVPAKLSSSVHVAPGGGGANPATGRVFASSVGGSEVQRLGQVAPGNAGRSGSVNFPLLPASQQSRIIRPGQQQPLLPQGQQASLSMSTPAPSSAAAAPLRMPMAPAAGGTMPLQYRSPMVIPGGPSMMQR
eukprot:TRINITY_DN14475_c0_g1_i1.p1 TRINITY_DN14475_c0_g1~~TRINITY_DN14475_c0_g1_i1.p1  ORF type:complete len:896 (-),score=244.05 TRINITY_DN14475_c0_g1_i1:398-3085(-)